jgi:hypothetical protein
MLHTCHAALALDDRLPACMAAHSEHQGLWAPLGPAIAFKVRLFLFMCHACMFRELSTLMDDWRTTQQLELRRRAAV